MKKIGKYEILEELGKGGMGTVYKAYDPQIDREVAIKIVSERALEIPQIKARFYREARTAGKLSHENITIVHDLGEIDGKIYIVMEYLHGRDLRSIIANKEPISLQQKLDYAKQICKGLQFAHSNKVIHRDIKPENIKILEDGRVKIMDFGIAKPDTSTMTQAGMAKDTVLTQLGMRVGTPWYMSPEQVRGSAVDRRSDIFSFGVLLYEFMTYEKPFEGDDTTVLYKILHEEPGRINLEESGLVNEVQEVLSKCLEKEPDARYKHCSELLKDLSTIFDKAQQEKRIKELLTQGHSLAEKKRFNEAILRFNEILKIDPNHAEANANTKKLIEKEKESATIKILTGQIAGDVISHFKIIERLGGGGMGVVYKAEDMTLKRIVALKFLSPDLTRDAKAKKRFLKEAQAASALDHPNICTIHEINETEEGLMFICMAYCEGENLRAKIDKGKLEILDSLRIVAKIARGLAKAHEHGIVHRDIKPANIIITTEGDVKIVDFGVAKLTRGATRLTQPGTAMGTLPYMSPEQVKGLDLDHRSDIWSLSALLYEILTGQLPYQGEYEAAVLYSIVNEDPTAASELNTKIPSELEEVINKALKKQVDDRYASMQELLDDLEKIQWHLSRAEKMESERAAELARLIENGKIYLNKKQDSDALSRFEAALKLEPTNQELLRLRGQCRRKQDELEQISKILSDAKSYLEKGKYQEALNAFKQIIAIDPKHSESNDFIEKVQKKIEQSKLVESLLSEAGSCLKKNEFEQAIEAFEKILKVEPQNQKARSGIQQAEEALAQQEKLASLIAEGKSYLKDNKYSDALSRFKAALELDKKNREVLGLIAECERKQKELQQIQKLLSLGKKYFEKGKFKEALKTFNQIIAIDPKHPESNDFIEKIQKKIERSDLVEQLLSDAESDFENKKLEQAEETYKKILKVEPQNQKARSGLQQVEKAIAQLAELDSLIAEGKSHFEDNKYSDALSCFKAALDLDKKNREVLDLTAGCESKQKELQQIQKLLSLGKKYFEKGNYEDALNAFKEIMAIDPDHPESNDFIEKIQEKIEQTELVDKLLFDAEFYHRRKSFEQAIECYKRILELDPENNIATRGLKKAKKGSEENVKQFTGDLPTQAKKVSSKTIWLGFTSIAIIGIFVGLYFFVNSNQVDKVDLSEPASAAKQDMLHLKSEAQTASAETWAEEMYVLALQKEQIGDKEFASGNYGAARQAYVEAGDNFRKSKEEANVGRAAADLNRLIDSAGRVRQAMLNQKSAAENVGAKIKAKELYENAIEKELKGDDNFKKGDRNSLIAAQIAYAEAIEGYKKARDQLASIDLLRDDAVAARIDMTKAKGQVPGREKDRSDNPNFNKAEELETAGQRHFQTGNFNVARSSLLQAKDLYLDATKEITKLLRNKADTAKESMLAAKAKIDKDRFAEAKYKEAIEIEKEANNAYGENYFDKAAERYKAAQHLYVTVSREAEEKIAREREKKEIAQREIQSLINKYKKILENGDIYALKALLSLTEQEESSWQKFFKNAQHIKATIENRGLQFLSSNEANVDLFVRLSYYNKSNNRRENRPFPITLILETVDDKWEIVSQK